MAGCPAMMTQAGVFAAGAGRTDTKIRWKNWKASSLERETGATFSTSSSAEELELELEYIKEKDVNKGQFGYLVSENGWQVRRMVEKEEEMRMVTQVQAQAFHEPVLFFNDLFFQFFQAEVFSGLLYRLRNSPSDRYACLVAESASNAHAPEQGWKIAGVVDVTVLRDEDVLQHLPAGVNEYLYVSGIAVLSNFRRRKVATTLLKGCEILSLRWGYKYLVLRAYEDDLGARKLYTNAGYEMVSGDPPWTTTWIGRKRRVLMIKRSAKHT
ncbi:hypothetical protein LguiA_019809 [Lonicera macranthoides]